MRFLCVAYVCNHTFFDLRKSYDNGKYTLPPKKTGIADAILHHPKSGTKIAYEYAVKKNKKIINLINELKID